MAEQIFEHPKLLVTRAESLVNRAVVVRGGLTDTTPRASVDFHNLGGLATSGTTDSLIAFKGNSEDLIAPPERWIAAVLAGDCIDLETEEVSAQFTESVVGVGCQTFRTPLLMSIQDALRLVNTCATLAELPVSCIAVVLKKRLASPNVVSLKDRLSPDGHPPFAPRLVGLL